MSSSPAFCVSRRAALRQLGLGAAAVIAAPALLQRAVAQAPAAGAPAEAPDAFSLPPLGYAYDALEPHLDARTMEIHHTRHHQAYVNGANQALAAYPEVVALGGVGMLKAINALPEAVRTAVRNHVGGHANHSLFWRILTPGGAKEPVGELASEIDRTFGGLEALRTELNNAALRQFGSGWGWLSVREGRLFVHATANQDSPLMSGAVPILGIDVWEHAYYLRYQNRRADYVAAIWNVFNWDVINAHYEAAIAA